MDAKELCIIKQNSFDKWFERWWGDQDLIKILKESAMKGYSGYSFIFDDDYYINRRMRDSRFVEKLKEKLPGFNINYQTDTKTYQNLLGMTRQETTEKITISWTDEDES